MRVSDVTLPNGRVLRFEVRFGANAGSPKTATTWPTGSPTGIAHVNIDNNNTRMVKDLSTPEGVAPLAEKLKPPEGVCYKQRPTIRTWPARYVRIEGKYHKQSTFLLLI